ncbi:hypothetical protein CASFOL_042372 [Castilleja foliolosa]|uniref:Ankyrin repeat domain-containing protein n=1 Tax=Castilleja foliolosa TaxID=1961234 RepID=A0ABD3BAT2_9LAMI
MDTKRQFYPSPISPTTTIAAVISSPPPPVWVVFTSLRRPPLRRQLPTSTNINPTTTPPNAASKSGSPLSDTDVSNFCNQTTIYRPGMDVIKAELISRTNWRRQEKIENVGEWKARVYDFDRRKVEVLGVLPRCSVDSGGSPLGFRRRGGGEDGGRG